MPRLRSCSGWSTRTCSCSPACCSSRHARRPLRAQARAPGRRLHLRARQPGSPARELLRSGDHGARGDGGRGGPDMPATLFIANVFTGEERGKAIGIWAALAAVGIGLGPLAGGLLLEWFPWWSVFMVNVPFAVARCARDPLRAGEPRSPPRLIRSARSGALHCGLQHPRLRDHRGARERLDVRARDRVLDGELGCWAHS